MLAHLLCFLIDLNGGDCKRAGVVMKETVVMSDVGHGGDLWKW